MRDTVINEITSLAGRDRDVFFVTGDAGFGILDEFQKKNAGRFLNLGVAEQNMLSFASGLALSGYKVFVYDIIPFLLYRCYEQVRNDVCYQRLPVTLVGTGSGVAYAPQGVTHYAVEDIAIARTLPNLEILSPCDQVEARSCVAYARKSLKPTYIRLSKACEGPVHPATGRIQDITVPSVVREGGEVALLFHGSIGAEVVSALEKTKFHPLVISTPVLNPLDAAFLAEKLRGIHTVITVEEHFVSGGLGSMIAEWKASGGLAFRLIRLGIANEFIHAIKNNSGLRDKYGISAPKICSAIESAFAK
ncbi:MAG: transketolase C-terminal domain-containing protein [Elusimicrobiales bacterium]|jgi:transketolase